MTTYEINKLFFLLEEINNALNKLIERSNKKTELKNNSSSAEDKSKAELSGNLYYTNATSTPVTLFETDKNIKYDYE